MSLLSTGFIAFVLSGLALAAAVYFKLPVTIVVDKFFKFMTSAVIFSFTLSVCLYIKSFFVNKKKLASNGNTGLKLKKRIVEDINA